MQIIRKHRRAFAWQTNEQVEISTSKCHYTLNRKDDWNSSKTQRLVVEVRGELMGEDGDKWNKRGANKQNPREGHNKKLQAETKPNNLPIEETEAENKRPDQKVVTPQNPPKYLTPFPPPTPTTEVKTSQANPKCVKLGPGYIEK